MLATRSTCSKRSTLRLDRILPGMLLTTALLPALLIISGCGDDGDDCTSAPEVTSITLVELTAGPHATADPVERGRRQDRLQRTEAAFDPLPFDANAARAHGRVSAFVTETERKARGARAVNLLIAATALSTGFPSTPATETTSVPSKV